MSYCYGDDKCWICKEGEPVTNDGVCSKCAEENPVCKSPQTAEAKGSTELACYDAASAELRKLLADCIKNRDDVDPELEDEKWKGFIQGVEMAIYHLETHSAT